MCDHQRQGYRVYTYEGPIAKIENVLVVISYEVNGDGFKKPIFLISTDIELDAKTIIEYYSKRWAIETNYKYLKLNLGFDKYKVRSLLSIERYFLIVFLSINFLEIFKIIHKEFVLYIYFKAKNNVPIIDIYNQLKIA